MWTTVVSGTFHAARSLALAVTVSGTAVAQAIVPILTQWLIAEFGWRQAYLMLGFGWGAVAFSLSAVFLYDRHDRARLGRENLIASHDAPREGATLTGLSVREALRSRPLVYIGISTFLTMLMGIGIMVHAVPIMVESGISRESAAYYVSLFGVAGIAGKLVTGWLMDHYNPGVVGGLTLGISSFAFLLLLEQFAHPAILASGLMVIGYASGTKLQICAYLTGCYAGLRNYGKIFGVMSSLIALGGGTGPALAGASFDLTGGYSLFIHAAVVLTLGAAVLLFRRVPGDRGVYEMGSSQPGW